MRTIYRLLALANDAKAISRHPSRRNPHPVARRIGRRVYGRASGALARRLFG